MNLLQLKDALGSNFMLTVSYTTRMYLHARFADRGEVEMDKLPEGHYLIIRLPMPPTPESGVFSVAEPKDDKKSGIRGKHKSVPLTPNDNSKTTLSRETV